jgi:hypothetical protein
MTVLALDGLRRTLRLTRPRGATDAATEGDRRGLRGDRRGHGGRQTRPQGRQTRPRGATDASVGPPLLRLAAEVATDVVVLSTRYVYRLFS